MKIRSILNRLKRKPYSILSNKKKAAAFWDETNTATSSAYWWNNKTIRHFIQQEITGNGSIGWHTKKILDRLTPFGRTLAFGDGYGMAVEAHLKRSNVTEIIYMNVSVGESERFVKLIEETGVDDIPYSTVIGDANHFDFSKLGMFDTIIDVGAFHHFKNFETIFPQLNNQLKPDGFMYIDEYIGPSKWKFPQPVVDIINNYLETLPGTLIKNRKLVSKKDFQKLWQQSEDPSEAIRSSELDCMLNKHFQIIEKTQFGGSLLQPFFLTFYLNPCRINIDNWHFSEIGKSESNRLVQLEKKLIDSKKLSIDYVYYILKRKGVQQTTCPF